VQSLRELDDAGTRVVAVDLPTGVNADTGEIARRAVRADLTVTFGHPKRGHVLYPGRAFAGMLEIVDIGLEPASPDAGRHPFELAGAAAMAELLPERDPRAHKGRTGRVLIVGGSVGLTGAVALAARAATRAGAGYVQAAVPASLNDALEAKLTEQMTIPCPETGARAFALDALEPILKRAAAADVLVLGSGLSRAPEAVELARRLAAQCALPQVIDADGLNALAGTPALLEKPKVARVLTPHLGEAARLTGVAVEALEAHRLDAAREWAMRFQCVLVLKGAPTVTGAPDGIATVNPTGNAGMATAGVGDVLSGVIAALIGQGLGAYDAARLAVYLHGAAGDLAAAELGPIGFSAGDCLERLPHAIGQLMRVREERLAAGQTAGSPRVARGLRA
jgi:NAD(P)H-hydrate epimerase